MGGDYYDGHLINRSSSTGYPTIFIDGKNVLLHRYVWEKHNGHIPNGYEIHHKDRNRMNYDVDNLTLIKSIEHHRKHAIMNGFGKGNKGKAKIYQSGFCGLARQIIGTNGVRSETFQSISEASKKLVIKTSMICRVLQGSRKTTKGWSFRYVTTGKEF